MWFLPPFDLSPCLVKHVFKLYQSILKEISPKYSSEGLMLKLKLQYFGYLMQRANSLEKTLMLGRTEGGKRRGRQVMRWYHRLNGHAFE